MSKQMLCIGSKEWFPGRLAETATELRLNCCFSDLPSLEGSEFSENDVAILVFEWSAKNNPSEAWEKIHAKYPRLPALFITDLDTQSIFGAVSPKDIPDHLMPLGEGDTFDYEDFSSTVNKMVGGDIFGLIPYLIEQVDCREITVLNSDFKSLYINEVILYAVCEGFRQRVVTRIADVVDEMVMNAIYNAPTDENGHHLYQKTSRSQTVELSQDKSAVLSYAFHGDKVMVSVKDPFGSIQRNEILERLAQCYSGGENQIDKSKAGAGLGIFHILESARSLVVNIDAGRATEFIATISKSDGHRAQGAKSFHIFTRAR